jgi:hypothetical protein
MIRLCRGIESISLPHIDIGLVLAPIELENLDSVHLMAIRSKLLEFYHTGLYIAFPGCRNALGEI